ncbi:hypothetical protein VDGD_21648 [Verticillium dahliae]|nr:hypothetical protein VDGD_21648 [Verticillium dahliae]
MSCIPSSPSSNTPIGRSPISISPCLSLTTSSVESLWISTSGNLSVSADPFEEDVAVPVGVGRRVRWLLNRLRETPRRGAAGGAATWGWAAPWGGRRCRRSAIWGGRLV